MRRRTLGRVYRYSSTLGSYSKTEEEARDEEMRPRVSDALPDAGREREEGCHKNGTSATQPPVERLGEPTSNEGAAELERDVSATGGRGVFKRHT